MGLGVVDQLSVGHVVEGTFMDLAGDAAPLTQIVQTGLVEDEM